MAETEQGTVVKRRDFLGSGIGFHLYRKGDEQDEEAWFLEVPLDGLNVLDEEYRKVVLDAFEEFLKLIPLPESGKYERLRAEVFKEDLKARFRGIAQVR